MKISNKINLKIFIFGLSISLLIGIFIGYFFTDLIDVNKSPKAIIQYNVNEKDYGSTMRPYVSTLTDGSFVYQEDELTLYGIESRDDDGIIVNYIWEFSDDEIKHFGNKIIKEFLHPGNYDISLTVVDNDGAYETIRMNLEVREKPRILLIPEEDKLIFHILEQYYQSEPFPIIGLDEILISYQVDTNDNGWGSWLKTDWMDNDNNSVLSEGDSILFSEIIDERATYYTFKANFNPYGSEYQGYMQVLWKYRIKSGEVSTR